VASLPNNASSCTTIRDPDGTLYTCDGVIYRPTYYKDEQVYEIVTPAEESTPASSTVADNDQDAEELLLTSPLMRGERVRALQNALRTIGFDVGTVDGIFGRDTDRAVREFQEWYEMPVTGVVDNETATAIGEAYTWTISPETASYGEEPAEPTGEGSAIPATDGTQADDATAAPQADDATPAPQADDATAAPQTDGAAAAPQTDAGGDSSMQGDDAGGAAETEVKEDSTQSD
jgi:hypothetical protein